MSLAKKIGTIAKASILVALGFGAGFLYSKTKDINMELKVGNRVYVLGIGDMNGDRKKDMLFGEENLDTGMIRWNLFQSTSNGDYTKRTWEERSRRKVVRGTYR